MAKVDEYPTVTGLDADDTFLTLVDGSLSNIVASTAKVLMLPSGTVDVSDYSTSPGALINAADATTGWSQVGVSSISLDTTTKSEGTASIIGTYSLVAGTVTKYYYTPPGTQSITGHTLVAFDVRWFATGAVTANVGYQFEARVADGAALTAGNINRLNLAGIPYGTFVTVVLPLTGLSNITSIGLFRSASTTGVTNDRVQIRVDNVRFINETKLDAALGSAASSVAIVPPSYTPDANQTPLYLPAGKAVLDPAKGVYSKQNNVVWLHDYLAHVIGGETGEVNVGATISRVISAATPGQTIRATPGAIYRFDAAVSLRSLRDLTLDFTGATIILTYQEDAPFFEIVLCKNITIIGGTWLGYGALAQNGSALTNVTGTPTVSGTTKLLDAASEEVKLPTHTNWLLASHFARHLPQQLGLAADGAAPRCYWEFVLSDTAQVASDCVISVYDDTTGTLLTSSTLTLTGTPTTYRVSYTPTDLRQRHKVTVKKSTATANTITVTSATPYGENEYNATYDTASCFVLTSSSYIKIIDAWIEGFGGDAVQVSDNSVAYVEVRRVTSRACRRQGMSFNQGTDMTVEGCSIAETGRSGLDFEPFATTWSTRRVTVRNTTFYNITNYGFAMQNWARNFDYLIDGVDLYESRLGMIFGGFTGGVMKNMRNWSALNYGASTDYDPFGISMEISDIRSRVAIQLHTTTNTYDDGGGVVTFTPANNIVHNRSINPVVGTGVAWVSGYRPDSLSDITVAAGATSHAVVFAGYTIPTVYMVQVETNWNSGAPYVTAKTSAGFTINFPNAAPGDGSGRISWSWVK